MGCMTPICHSCKQYDCGGFNGGPCTHKSKGKNKAKVVSTKDTLKEREVTNFDTSGALCDVLSLLEKDYPDAFEHVDVRTLVWWGTHEKDEQNLIRAEALAKLSPREKRALGLD